MTFNLENGISALKAQIGHATYSMNYSRNFSDGTCDCSGAVYYALRLAGLPSLGYIPSTETLHSWLLSNGFELIAENQEWQMQEYDVIIWGKKGASAGSFGHTGIALDAQNWIECTGWSGGGNGPDGGVIISNHDQRWTMCGCPYFYVYRLKNHLVQQNKINYPMSKEESEMLYSFAVKGGTGTMLFDGQNTLAFTGKNAKAAYDHYVGTYKEIMGKELPHQIKTEAQFKLWSELYPVKYLPFN
ncbi:peptidoglycan amidohydrolase family protein [Lactococcus lactis]|uniref:Bacteriophage lysin domain-containing protein n=2 Tax=Lactococcus lactis TaxID=1358 RepID=A0AAW5TMB0_9LACT|nr:peptidoglycan amidohydrolase family protein [Lactococcus lactis]MCW2279866.1 hypothetical protein [Lactococcus lactis]MCW2280410.1 hypothetical protein [Lactococcus lactis]